MKPIYFFKKLLVLLCIQFISFKTLNAQDCYEVYFNVTNGSRLYTGTLKNCIAYVVGQGDINNKYFDADNVPFNYEYVKNLLERSRGQYTIVKCGNLPNPKNTEDNAVSNAFDNYINVISSLNRQYRVINKNMIEYHNMNISIAKFKLEENSENTRQNLVPLNQLRQQIPQKPRTPLYAVKKPQTRRNTVQAPQTPPRKQSKPRRYTANEYQLLSRYKAQTSQPPPKAQQTRRYTARESQILSRYDTLFQNFNYNKWDRDNPMYIMESRGKNYYNRYRFRSSLKEELKNMEYIIADIQGRVPCDLVFLGDPIDYRNFIDLSGNRGRKLTFTQNQIKDQYARYLEYFQENGPIIRNPRNIIEVNFNKIENEPISTIIYVLAHESFHAYQVSQINRWRQGAVIIENRDLIRQWAHNRENYITANEDDDGYNRQILEADANAFAETIVKIFKDKYPNIK